MLTVGRAQSAYEKIDAALYGRAFPQAHRQGKDLCLQAQDKGLSTVGWACHPYTVFSASISNKKSKSSFSSRLVKPPSPRTLLTMRFFLC